MIWTTVPFGIVANCVFGSVVGALNMGRSVVVTAIPPFVNCHGNLELGHACSEFATAPVAVDDTGVGGSVVLVESKNGVLTGRKVLVCGTITIAVIVGICKIGKVGNGVVVTNRIVGAFAAAVRLADKAEIVGDKTPGGLEVGASAACGRDGGLGDNI